MAVLPSTSVVCIAPQVPIYPSPRRSILDRRSSQKNISQDATSSTPSTSNGVSTLAAGPSVLVTNATATGTTLRVPRQSAAALLPFVPLTPIMASPRLTPDIGAGTGGGPSTNLPSALTSTQTGDYLTRGHPLVPPSHSIKEHLFTPSWTSTPPTPPQKGSSSSSRRLLCRRRSGNVRPASVAVFPDRGVLPPEQLSPSAPIRDSSSTSPMTPASSPEPGSGVKRSQTLPHDLGKLYAQPRQVRSQDRGLDGTLLPSISRASPLGSSVITREESKASGRSRRMFTLGDGEESDGEGEEGEAGTQRMGSSTENSSVEGASNENGKRVSGRAEMKRYHALMELLTTEVGYLMDLRALVLIYLKQLRAITIPVPSSSLSRSSPSTLSISGLNITRNFPSSRSFLHSNPTPGIKAGPGPPDVLQCDKHRDAFEKERAQDSSEKENIMVEKPARRPVLSEDKIKVIKRNAEGLLALHEKFVEELKEGVKQFGFESAFAPLTGKPTGSSNDEETTTDVKAAIQAVGDIFTRQASSFGMYEKFCSGHNEAADLIRGIQERYPTEWDAYEQCCSLRVAHMFELPSSGYALSSCGSVRSISSKHRRHSMSSLFPMSTTGMLYMPPLLEMATKSDPLPGDENRGLGVNDSGVSQASRLKLLDYLIKPVQRICKYPLLLDQVQIKRSSTEQNDDSKDVIRTAGIAIRDIVAAVDRASNKRAQEVKSASIASRIISSGQTSPSGTTEGKPASPNAEFMRSLGVCLLAGALDIVYTQSRGLQTKYRGVFLYAGYLVLVKVSKGGKSYEPRHWFPLSDFQIVDVEDDDAELPYVFYLHDHSHHHLYFAAACRLEKMVWMAAIQDALGTGRPSQWTNEPLQAVPLQEWLPAHAYTETTQDWSTSLPTIQSMSELETPSDPNTPAPPVPSPRKMARTMSKAGGVSMTQEHLSRRGSTSSVKAFIVTSLYSASISRPSTQQRHQIEQDLRDVSSDTLTSARSQALMRDEELFHVRKKPGPSVSRSNSGLSITGPFSSRKRLENTGVPKSRKVAFDDMVEFGHDAETKAHGVSSTKKTGVLKRRRNHPLMVIPSQQSGVSYGNEIDGDITANHSPEESLSPITRCSSASSFNAASTLPSPLTTTIQLPISAPVLDKVYHSHTRKGDDRPKRRRSMVDRILYRSGSPSPSFKDSPTSILEPETHPPSSFAVWWRRGSMRKRAASSPEVPSDDSSPPTPSASTDSHTGSRTPYSVLSPVASPNLSEEGVPITTQKRVEFTDTRPVRRRSLFSYSPRLDAQPHSVDPTPTLTRRSTLKNLLNWQRSSNPFSRVDLDSRS